MEKFVFRALFLSLTTLKVDFLGEKRFLEFLTSMFVRVTNVVWIVMKPKDKTLEGDDLTFYDVLLLTPIPITDRHTSKDVRSKSIQWLEGERLLRTKKGSNLTIFC